MTFDEFKVIFSYSRKEAIADGQQTCVSELYPNDCRLYKYPVYFTREVMGLLENSFDPGCIVWDICYMSINSPSRKELNQATYQFGVIVENAGRTPDFVEDGSNCYNLIVQVGATDFDNPAPAVTSEQLAAMLSEEKKQNIPASSIFNSIPGKKGIVFWVNRQKYFFTWVTRKLYKYKQSCN